MVQSFLSLFTSSVILVIIENLINLHVGALFESYLNCSFPFYTFTLNVSCFWVVCSFSGKSSFIFSTTLCPDAGLFFLFNFIFYQSTIVDFTYDFYAVSGYVYQHPDTYILVYILVVHTTFNTKLIWPDSLCRCKRVLLLTNLVCVF